MGWGHPLVSFWVIRPLFLLIFENLKKSTFKFKVNYLDFQSANKLKVIFLESESINKLKLIF
jgi:hypothetical protein